MLGPWANSGWLNAVAVVIISVLLLLSGLLMATTLFPGINVALLMQVLGGVLTVTLVAFGGVWLARRRPEPQDRDRRRLERDGWTMPPLALVDRPTWSPMRSVAVGAICVYLVVAILLLLVKCLQLATGM